MKKHLLMIALVITTAFISCESDSGCENAALWVTNGTSFSIGLTINGKYKSLKPSQTISEEVAPNSSISYSAVAGIHSWGNSFVLDDCEIKHVRLTTN